MHSVIKWQNELRDHTKVSTHFKIKGKGTTWVNGMCWYTSRLIDLWPNPQVNKWPFWPQKLISDPVVNLVLRYRFMARTENLRAKLKTTSPSRWPHNERERWGSSISLRYPMQRANRWHVKVSSVEWCNMPNMEIIKSYFVWVGTILLIGPRALSDWE